MIFHSFRLSYVCKLILAHIWDALGSSSEIRCDSDSPRSSFFFAWLEINSTLMCSLRISSWWVIRCLHFTNTKNRVDTQIKRNKAKEAMQGKGKVNQQETQEFVLPKFRFTTVSILVSVGCFSYRSRVALSPLADPLDSFVPLRGEDLHKLSHNSPHFGGLWETPSRLRGNHSSTTNDSHKFDDDVQQSSRDSSALELLTKASLYHSTH
jgi:hypothetical protein